MKLAFFEAPVQEKEADLEKGKKIRDIFKIVGVSIEDYGDIFDRIKEMHAEENSHFSDAVKIMCMVEKKYAIDNFPERTVREAVEIIYKDESGKRLEALAGCGVDAGWGMREFFGM